MSAKVPQLEVTDAQLAEMAKTYATSLDTCTNVKVDYLRILVARAKVAARQGKKNPTPTQARRAVDAAHERMYDVVLKAVTTPDIAPDDALKPIDRAWRSLERNRRSNFARTAKYVLDAWLDAGGRLMNVPVDVTREWLRKHTAANPEREPDRLAGSFERSADRIFKAATALVEGDRVAAERLIAACVSQLTQLIAKPLTKRRIKELNLHPVH